MSRDVVLSCFATPSPQTLGVIKQGPKGDGYFQPSDRYKEPPLVLDIYAPQLPGEKSVSPAFERAAQAFKQRSGKNSIIKGALDALAPGVDVRTVTIVTFSGGQAFAKAVMANGEGKYVDGMILLDGLHLSMANTGPVTDGIPSEWQPWADYGMAAAVNGKLLVLLHTQIQLPPKIRALNTTQSAALITKDVKAAKIPELSGACSSTEFLSAVAAGPPPPTVEIQGFEGAYPNGKWVSKTWDSYPLDFVSMQGSYFEIGLKGTGPQDHIFAATYGQRTVWDRILAPRLNQDENQCIVTVTAPLPVIATAPGIRATASEPCVKPLTLLPADLQGAPSPSSGGTILFTAAGLGLGYLIGRQLWS